MDGKKRIVFAFCVCIVLLALIGGYSYLSTRKYAEASGWVNHSQEAINEVKNIYASAQDIESSQRGYVIAGEQRYLGPFDRAINHGKNACFRAQYSVRNDPEQLRTLENIRRLFDQKTAFATRVVNLRKNSGFEAAQQLMMGYEGERIMNAIRSEITRFTHREESLLSARLTEEQNRFQQVIMVIILLVVVSIAVIFLALYLFIKDYNRRLRSEEIVRESEIRFKMMLESIPIGVLVFQSDGRIYYSNENAVKILGKDISLSESLEEIRLNRRFFVAGTDEPYPVHDGPLTKGMRGEASYNLENIEMETGTGRIRLRLTVIPLFNRNGVIEYVISLFEDISVFKKAEMELIQAKSLAEESLLLKETFLANMSHEIRTPMNAILGFTDLLLKEPISEKERDYVNTIRTSGENLLRIINDILDLSKIEANMMEFEQHPLNIPDIFGSLETMLSHKAREKKLTLAFKPDPRLSATLMGDPTRLTQIIINLVGNAIKFTRKGSVTIEALLVDQDRESCTVNFAITDTGIGIPPDKLNAIFERFRQAEVYTTRSYGGTGLGLSIARQLVELQGGRMEITSEVDKGSCFSFELRFLRPTEAMLQQEKKERHIINFDRIRRMHILLAEDNPINVKLIRNLFEAHEVPIDVVENGMEVIECLKIHTFDLILMDLEMPVMNGYETTRVIREEMHLFTPIIAMTAHAMAGEQEKCLQMGMNDFISKPINITTLFEKMDQIAQSSDGFTTTGPTENHNAREPRFRVAESSGDRPETWSGSEQEGIGKIDLTYLKELSSGNRNFEKEMLTLFMQQIPTELLEMRAAYEQNDRGTLKNLAHKMKSSVPLVGAGYLVSLLNKLEDAEDQGISDEAYRDAFESFAEQLEACFGSVTETLATYQGS